jgi:hypothetical protein
MEVIGSSKIVQDLFANYLAYDHKYVGNDDLSTKQMLQHLWQHEMEAGMREDIPQYQNKKNGQHTLTYQSPLDCMVGRQRTLAVLDSLLLFLFCQKKVDCEGTLMDAKRLKRNLSYTIRVNCHSMDIQVLRNAVELVLEHHFNKHSLCGEWCKLKNLA